MKQLESIKSPTHYNWRMTPQPRNRSQPDGKSEMSRHRTNKCMNKSLFCFLNERHDNENKRRRYQSKQLTRSNHYDSAGTNVKPLIPSQ